MMECNIGRWANKKWMNEYQDGDRLLNNWVDISVVVWRNYYVLDSVDKYMDKLFI
jgi:hypothetical protein